MSTHPSRPAGLGDPAALAAPFPFHLLIDASLRLSSFGHGLARFDPGLRPGVHFDEHFEVLRPSLTGTWTEIVAAANSAWVISHRRTGLELRGQLLVPDPAGPAIFLGTSWLDDPTQLAEFGAGSVSLDNAAVAGAPPPQFERSGPSLALQLAVTSCLAEATGTNDAVVRLVDALPFALGWAGAVFWRPGGDGRLLPERRAPERFVPPPGAAALIERARAGGAPVLDGAAFALPILGGDGCLGVVAAFQSADDADAGRDPELLHALAVAGGLIAQFISRQAVGERLRRVTSELAAIFQLSPDGFVAFDETGLLTYINPAMLRMTGFTREQLEGCRAGEFEARLEALVDPVHPPAHANGAEILHLLRPRPRVLQRARREAHDPEGRLFGRILYFRDITHETQVDRMKNEFLSTAAHELRTPLASIHGFTELLLQRDFAPAQRQDILNTIFAQTTRLVAMVNGLLDLARIEAGAGEDFVRVVQPLLPLIESTLGGFMVAGDPRRVEFLSDPGDAELHVAIDRDKFIRALTNVLSNAFKYSPQGGAIELSLRRGTGRVGIAVRDHGIGMSQEAVRRVFERFFRADPSGPIPGTGLGMALVKQIVELHDGSVELDSAPASGTEVTLWLPLVAAPPAASAAAPARPRRKRQARAGST